MNGNIDLKNIKTFMKYNFRHFNAAVVVYASEAYVNHINNGGKIVLALAGAMSTAELGITLAEMIRKDKIHAISCTGANLEEDIFNLIAHNDYKQVPYYRDLLPKDEKELLNQGLNRVTDTCIPEEKAMIRIEKEILTVWKKAEEEKKRYYPFEFIFQLIQSGALKNHYQIKEKNSWIIAACEKNIPIFVPGWEDSTLGNFFASCVQKGIIKNISIVKSGIETMNFLIDWYMHNSLEHDIGFFQIGGGIAGDFSICVVPLIRRDLEIKSCKFWSYFCQISDSTTSYGSYSGAVPNEKITWGKLSVDSKRYIIESDATIVAPLIFAYVLAE